MSSKKESSSSKRSSNRRGDSKRKEAPEPQRDNFVDDVSDDEDVIDSCDDHDYQVLSAVFETDKGRNIAEILSRLQKAVSYTHLTLPTILLV